ncbi:MAG: hypothetical protein ACRDSN_19000, partial [Pseudonocardiaceae bacterium]
GATDSSSIKASVTRILRTFVRLEPVTRSIDRGVAAINGRADRAIDLARAAHGDLNAVNNDVTKIDAHANSIDCAPLLNIVGQTQGCQR